VAQMPLAEHDDMIKTFASNRADEPLYTPILPWRFRKSSNSVSLAKVTKWRFCALRSAELMVSLSPNEAPRPDVWVGRLLRSGAN